MCDAFDVMVWGGVSKLKGIISFMELLYGQMLRNILNLGIGCFSSYFLSVFFFYLYDCLSVYCVLSLKIFYKKWSIYLVCIGNL